MATYSITAPDGKTYQIDGPDGASQTDVIQQVLSQHPNAGTPPPPVKGLAADFGSALSTMGTDIGTGFKSFFGDANKAATEGLAAREAAAQKYQTSDSLENIKKAYESHSGLGALTSAASAAIGEVPHAVAGALPGMAEFLAPPAIGGAIGTMIAPGVGTAIGAGAGRALSAGLAYLQAQGAGVTKQAEEQQKQGQPANVDVGRAALFAAPEAALNYVEHVAPLGKTVSSKLFGPKVEALLAKGATEEAEIAAQNVLANQGFWKTLGTGAVKGAAIGAPAMVAQVALERAQAKQSLFDEDAYHEYGSAFTNGLLAAGPMGSVGAFAERGNARDAVAERQAEANRAAQEAENAHKQTPEYAETINTQVQDLQALREGLKESAPSKPAKDSPTYEADAARYDAYKEHLADIGQQLQALEPEHTRTQAIHNPTPETAAEKVGANPLVALKEQEAILQNKLYQPLPETSTPEHATAVAERQALVAQLGKVQQEIRSVAAEQALKPPAEIPATDALPPTSAEIRTKYDDLVNQRQQAKDAVAAATDPAAKKEAALRAAALIKQIKVLEPEHTNAQEALKAKAPDVADRASQILADPVLARRYLAEMPHATDYTPEQNTALHSLVKLRMAEKEKQAAAKRSAAKALAAAKNIAGAVEDFKTPPVVTEEVPAIVKKHDPKKTTTELVGRYVRYAGAEGYLVKKPTGLYVVDIKGPHDVLVESGESNKTAASLGVMPTGTPKAKAPTPPKRPTSVYRTQEGAKKGAPAEYVQRLANKMVEGWTGAPKIQVHADESTLPAGIQAQMAHDKVSGNVPGLYEPSTKTVHLISKNLGSKEDIIATIVHEVAGHHGLREMLGNKYHDVMNQIYAGNKTVREAADAKLEKTPSLGKQLAVEEVLAEMSERPETSTPEVRSALRKVYDAVKQWFHDTLGIPHMSDNAVKQIVANARKHAMDGAPSEVTHPADARAPYRVNENLKDAVELADKLVAQPRTKVQQVKEAAQNGNLLSLSLVTKMIDQYEPVYRALKGKISDAVGMRVAYGLKEFNQASNLISAAMRYGAPRLVESKTSKAGAREYLFETASNAPSMESLNKILTEAHALTGSDKATGALWSLYTAAQRAENVGLHKLNFDPEVTQAKLSKAMQDIRATPGLEAVFKRAADEWQKVNAANIEFTVQTGFLSRETARTLLAHKDYVPYYREDANGNVSMFAGGTEIVRMGSAVDHPYLHELVGDNKRILDFNTAAQQNISMLIRAGLKNYAAQGAAEALRDVGMADISKGVATSKDNVFSFKKDGVDHRVVVNDTNPDVPAKLLVQGLQGIPTQTNALLKIAGMPSQLMRSMYVSNPISAVKNIFKDTLSAWLVSGSDLKSVLGAFKSVEDNLMVRRGLSGGEVFQGLPADQVTLLNQVRSGKPGWATAVAKLHAIHARLDAVSRQARYESYLKEGMSDLGASLAALNSANFTRRGMSSSLHILNTLNPFINSQIQGMDNLYRAARGTMMFEDKLKMRQKLIQRGMLVATGTMLYAALMQDDDAYKNATPDQKFNNWFVRVPMVDEPLRVPIPFEAGLVVKSLSEALVSHMYDNDKEAFDGLKIVAQRLIPGGDTYGIPLILRPSIEAGLDKSFYTGRDLETKHEQGIQAGYRTRPNTSALADNLGEQLDMSPVKIDHLISGHTGTLGLAVTQLVSSLIFGKDTPEVEGRLSQTPVIGSSFQPEDAGNTINRAYAAMEEVAQVKRTYDELMAKGRYDAAQAFLEKNAVAYSHASMGGQFQQAMGQLSKMSSQILNNTAIDMSPKDRREALKAIREQQTGLAKTAVSALGETTPQ